MAVSHIEITPNRLDIELDVTCIQEKIYDQLPYLTIQSLMA